MKQKKIKRGEFLQKAGELNSKIYHVKSGLLRSYSIDAKGKEHIFMFAPEGWVIADSCPPEVQTNLFIDALEDSIVIIREKDIQSEQKNVQPLVNRLLVLQKRVIMLMSASAIERYEHFIETYPGIAQRVPQKMIASYLGITPEALSNVKRKRITNK
ncbi:Crp/Fnr family transcriptional regulator [Aquimarina gracilis]|uniref:Crp/Fnr family transcriptional regulator n=1 Tax=Aquimarina gracilis TaxID=874422 RepID=A0ABU5ZWA8_9FLAO|nr:Crp/Fnr family transcriptional regulator [Aquimarina gracilis]MEB3346152.1 Crp/Fnr family transcriptional regulator [Aquimarina gracilis]